MVLGFTTGRWFLEWLDTPQDIIDLASAYFNIYMCGIPAVTLYSFSAAVFRAQGNTKSPLIYLIFAGLMNVVLNLIFVIGFHWSVEGIAWATVISQYFSAFLALRHLKIMDEVYALKFKLINLNKKILKDIFYIGVPASVNSLVFSFSNMQIQSAINFFGSSAVAGCAVAGNLEGFVYISMNSMYSAALSFTGQNMGAGRFDRIPRILKINTLYVVILGLATGVPLTLFGESLIGLYTNDPEAIAVGMVRTKWIMLPYFLCGIMEVCTGVIRGLGYSITPTLITLAFACGLRVLWVTTIFRICPNLPLLFSIYTISWSLTTIGLLITYRYAMKHKTFLPATV